jgi:hypothetical protein
MRFAGDAPEVAGKVDDDAIRFDALLGLAFSSLHVGFR